MSCLCVRAYRNCVSVLFSLCKRYKLEIHAAFFGSLGFRVGDSAQRDHLTARWTGADHGRRVRAFRVAQHCRVGTRKAHGADWAQVGKERREAGGTRSTPPSPQGLVTGRTGRVWLATGLVWFGFGLLFHIVHAYMLVPHAPSPLQG